MEYINIIAKEEITVALDWPVVTVGILCIVALVGLTVYLAITKQMDCADSGVKIDIVGIVGITLMLITMIVCSVFFRVPTGRYKYVATIDKDKITVSQYEEFIEEYNPTIKDGIYYWEDKAE